MKKTNDTYCVVFEGMRTRERYYRDESGWLKVSSRGRIFRATAEQVLNHLLPALAFGKELKLNVRVEHYEQPYWETLSARPEGVTSSAGGRDRSPRPGRRDARGGSP